MRVPSAVWGALKPVSDAHTSSRAVQAVSAAKSCTTRAALMSATYGMSHALVSQRVHSSAHAAAAAGAATGAVLAAGDAPTTVATNALVFGSLAYASDCLGGGQNRAVPQPGTSLAWFFGGPRQ